MKSNIFTFSSKIDAFFEFDWEIKNLNIVQRLYSIDYSFRTGVKVR